MRSIYTDLALEAHELSGQSQDVAQEEEKLEGMTVTRVRVLNQQGAEKIGKPIGEYITIEAPALKDRDMKLFSEVSKKIGEELGKLMSRLGQKDTVLVVGLGNRNVTPDSLGPRVAEQAYVTRHITEYLPQLVDERVRPVCAVAPGVLGITGVETLEIIKGLVERIKPAMVIAIDSLASRRTDRLCTTVQLTDTGVSPGSGIGNNRSGINQESLGVPVVAIGIPLVVYASTISQDAITLLANETGMHADEEKLVNLVEKVVNEQMGPLIVTPKEIDTMVTDASRMVAEGINLSLHSLAYEEVKQLLA